MKATISNVNPFGASRYGYVFSRLEQHPSGRHLDYGCYDGAILAQLVEAGVVAQGVGVDMNRDAIEASTAASTDGVTLLSVSADQSLASVVGDHQFESVSLLDVLEHVHDQQKLLRELRSVLVPDGRLVVTVPKQHVFSILDVGNLKFRAPRIHRRLYLLRHSREEYNYRYVDNPHGLVGDVERAKSWHQHFSVGDLTRELSKAGFMVVDVDGAGFLHRPWKLLRRLGLPLDRLIDWDMRHFSSCHLFVTATATPTSTEPKSSAAARVRSEDS